MNAALSSLLRSIIVSKGLVNTGRLRDSIEVFTNVTSDRIQIDVRSVDYLKYLTEEYSIIKDFTEASEFSREIQKMMEPIFINQVQNALFNIEDLKIPRVFLTINGE